MRSRFVPVPTPARAKRCDLRFLALCSLAALVPLVFTACGSDDEPNDDGKAASIVSRSEQAGLDEAAWKAELSANTDLSTLASKVAQPFRAAGRIERKDGGRSLWAEYAADDDAARSAVITIWQHCDSDGTCQRGNGSHSATSAALTDAAGGAVATVDVGAPVLNKRLLEHNLTKAATVLVGAGLDRANPVDTPTLAAAAADVTWGKRRLLLLSAYGPAVGVDAASIVAAAQKTGLFERVDVVHFARRTDLKATLPLLSPLDVVVWLGAGVVEPFTDGKPDKSVGMTLSRGILGDELIHRDNTKGLFDQPPIGGPGLIVLAGGDSLTSDFAIQTGLLAQALQLWPLRPVVGFDGRLGIAGAEAGVAALLATLAAGKDLSSALAAGSAAASKANGSSGNVTMLAAVEAALTKDWKLPGPAASFWQAPPSKATLKLYVKITPKCMSKVPGTCDEAAFKASEPVTTGLTASTAIFECDATFVGPWFDCKAQNAQTGADFTARGVMSGRGVGDGVYLMVEGSPDKKVRGITLLGNGNIEAVDQGGGAAILRFGGIASASLYRDANDNCCIAIKPTLVGQKSTEELSTFKIFP